MYQGSAVACAMFITGQASNLLGANLALKLADVQVTAPSWFMAAIVPGLLSCLVVPWITYRDAHAGESRTRPRRRRSRAKSCARWDRSAATNGSR